MKSLHTIGLAGRLFKSNSGNVFNQIRNQSLKSAISLSSSRSLYPVTRTGLNFIEFKHRYSTASAPPPPTPIDKDAKGKLILNRINRAFTFSFATVLVVIGSAVAVLVLYLIFSELFLPTGDTRTFNKAVKLVEQSEKAQSALNFEAGTRLKAHGESHGGGNWVRNRPVHGLRSVGKDGKYHLLMKFHVKSDAGRHGTVVLEQIDNSFWSSDFAYIALDIAGEKRIWIIEPKWKSKDYVPKKGNGFLGLKWGPKNEE